MLCNTPQVLQDTIGHRVHRKTEHRLGRQELYNTSNSRLASDTSTLHVWAAEHPMGACSIISAKLLSLTMCTSHNSTFQPWPSVHPGGCPTRDVSQISPAAQKTTCRHTGMHLIAKSHTSCPYDNTVASAKGQSRGCCHTTEQQSNTAASCLEGHA
jgi:hypothetical protein